LIIFAHCTRSAQKGFGASLGRWEKYCSHELTALGMIVAFTYLKRGRCILVKNLPVVPSAKAGSMAENPSGISWREQHPEINTACNNCLVCTLFCPEGALVEQSGQVSAILNLCNGCGTCAVECPRKAITMVAEYQGAPGVFSSKGCK